MSEVRTGRGRLALAATLTAAAVAAAGPAGAACTTEREARDLQASLRDVVRCRDHALKGKTRACKQRPAPACADPLFGDALALVYGPNDPPAGAVDDRALRKQLRCQKKIGGAAAKYVGKRLRGLVRGKDEADAEQGARRKLDRLARHCNVSVAEDVGGVVLPAVGPQCAAARRRARRPRSPRHALGDCLATLLGVWVDRVGPTRSRSVRTSSSS